MNLKTEIRELVESVGGVLIREKKHLVFELPDGSKLTTAASPSSKRTLQEVRSDLIGRGFLSEERRAKAPADIRKSRRRRPGNTGEAKKWNAHQLPDAGNSMAEALRDSGLVEQQLRSENGQLRAGPGVRQRRPSVGVGYWDCSRRQPGRGVPLHGRRPEAQAHPL